VQDKLKTNCSNLELLKYPFDSNLLLKKQKSILKELKQKDIKLTKKIAILGGSTTASIKDILELFLLKYDIKPEFYESEYAMYWQDAMFGEKLQSFSPDIIFIHTSFRNITNLPTLKDSKEQICTKLTEQYNHFKTMWDKLLQLHCPIIQNNFERPIYRLMQNRDISDIHGQSNFISRLNQKFYEFSQSHNNFYINDLDYLSANYGLEKWHDVSYWNMFKYACHMSAIPYISYSVSNIIKSIYGKNKKGFVLDLDNTLWGGIIGDDGVDGIAIGKETAIAETYTEFQNYIKTHKDLGIILNVSSKNEESNALLGLKHPDGILKADDFAIIKANWNDKATNIRQIAKILNIGLDSLVFIDDNPVERAIVRKEIPEIEVPEVNNAEEYIKIIDGGSYFETTIFTEEDLNKNKMYSENAKRTELEESFTNYNDFLLSLNMKATIKDFESIYIQRISQLTNKSNQFNLTTKRYSESDIEQIWKNSGYIRLYGKLQDKFGDNGVVSVIIGKKDNDILNMELWLMSCRVLKREMEFAMLDILIEEAKKNNIKTIKGYYYPTPKNAMVKEFYGVLGFTKISEENGSSIWKYDVEKHIKKCNVIKIN
jgi:FkbH-like protein